MPGVMSQSRDDDRGDQKHLFPLSQPLLKASSESFRRQTEYASSL